MQNGKAQQSNCQKVDEPSIESYRCIADADAVGNYGITVVAHGEQVMEIVRKDKTVVCQSGREVSGLEVAVAKAV